MYKVKIIDIELMSRLLEYNPFTGLLYWKERVPVCDKDAHGVKSFNKRYAGKEVDANKHKNNHGNTYKKIKVNGEMYLYHRICWCLAKKEQPLFIDHINGDGMDNRIENLRSVDVTENNRNMRKNKLNKTGYMGVYRYGNTSRWVAYIWTKNKQVNLGIYDTKSEAVAARMAAEKIENYHKNHGNR